MRKTLMLSAAALMAVAFPSVAVAHSGYVGVSYNNGTFNPPSGPSPDFSGWAGDGAVAFDAGGMGIQLGGYYSSWDYGSGATITNSEVDAHLYHRDAHCQWGGALAYNMLDLPGSAGALNTWTVAGEAKWFMPNTTWGGSLSYSNVDAPGSSTVNAWRLGGDARVFISDNFALNAGLGYENLNGSGTSGNAWDGDVGAEFQFSSVPISIFGGYSGASASDIDVSSSRWTVGARWNFGGGTLRDRDHSGANLDHIRGPYERLYGG